MSERRGRKRKVHHYFEPDQWASDTDSDVQLDNILTGNDLNYAKRRRHEHGEPIVREDPEPEHEVQEDLHEPEHESQDNIDAVEEDDSEEEEDNFYDAQEAVDYEDRLQEDEILEEPDDINVENDLAFIGEFHNDGDRVFLKLMLYYSCLQMIPAL